jgi:hypothetical protein
MILPALTTNDSSSSSISLVNRTPPASLLQHLQDASSMQHAAGLLGCAWWHCLELVPVLHGVPSLMNGEVPGWKTGPWVDPISKLGPTTLSGPSGLQLLGLLHSMAPAPPAEGAGQVQSSRSVRQCCAWPCNTRADSAVNSAD